MSKYSLVADQLRAVSGLAGLVRLHDKVREVRHIESERAEFASER
jgi:hypothetical protein